MGSADCIQLGLLFGPDAHSLSTIKHYFTTLHSLTSEDCATLPKATKVRRIVTGQASGLTMQPTAGARQDDQSHCNSGSTRLASGLSSLDLDSAGLGEDR